MKKITFSAPIMLLSFASNALELPSIPPLPFPSPGSDEIVFVIRNTTDNVNVSITDYWSYRDIKRVPVKTVKSQSIFTTSGYKWMDAYVTVSINGSEYTMAALSGYLNGYSTTYAKVGKGRLSHNYYSVEKFVSEDKENIIPFNKAIDETPEYYITSESYISGDGNVVLMCIANTQTLDKCLSQE
ncbi:thermostable direct hemolysin-family toxin [Vibrio cholerae]|uniref:thermostable direct hemolysin-family toxin n=1 Tax=Vibrio cholerae TaxID=666 RepID=UPI000511673A|nr:thermostable direct hemolysin-family toxin [Vibrio cholerae]EKF9704142.1 thermostable direct hemolysin-family toxin [Vibrio cholerae]ELW1717461.1 thermostable direct hemolysin-family toxin [Vibrio cholerae]HDI3175217.1 thermostable direct hemolysin-family toxin [Vibrio cholerae]